MPKELNIGVMTWFSYENYGTVLQAVATQQVLRDLGHSPLLINYRPRSTRGRNEKLAYSDLANKAKSKIKRKLERKGGSFTSVRRSDLFSEFLCSYCKLSEPANSFPELRQLASNLDACICGSDQVWSPNCFDENYFLPFVEDANRKISYAPSFGASSIVDPEIKRRTRDLLADFGSISVRETAGAEIVESLTGSRPSVVLDPTLLLGKDVWASFAADKVNTPDRYVLGYFLGDSSRYERSAEACAEKLGLPLVCIPAFVGQKHSVGFEVGPSEFLKLFLNASYVLTDSFHGTAFATNFGVPFSVYKRFSDSDPKSQNSRITSFLGLVGLEDRLIAAEEMSVDTGLSFNLAHKKLTEMRSDSITFLKNALQKLPRESSEVDKVSSAGITSQCCGCGACAAACPKSAISVQLDVDGFQSYLIDESKCVDCGICRSVCPMRSVSAPYLRASLGLFAYQSNDEDGLRLSSSGAVGADLASLLLQDEYRVFGCVYDRATDSALIEEVDRNTVSHLRGSKYIQAKSAEALIEASSLNSGEIAFFGTPCQIAGLDALLRRKGNRNSAILVDLICHGVPSYNIWSRYLDERSNNGVGPHPEVLFRSKDIGWSPVKKIALSGPNGNYAEVDTRDNFYAFFNHSLCDSRSCYECPYRERSAADIRMGDYWGERFSTDKKGVSMVVAISDKGLSYLKLAESRGATLNEFDIQEYWDVQAPFNQGLPFCWHDVIADLRAKDATLSELRMKYCAGFDQRRRIDSLKKLIKKTLGKA